MKYAICPGEEFYANMLKSCRGEPETATVMLLWRTGMHSSTLVSGAYTFCLHNQYEGTCPEAGV